VPGRGLEPLRISPPDPKSGASANFATLASVACVNHVREFTLTEHCRNHLERNAPRELFRFDKAEVTAADDAAVAATDDRHPALQFSAATMLLVLGSRPRLHFIFPARLLSLMLRRLKSLNIGRSARCESRKHLSDGVFACALLSSRPPSAIVQSVVSQHASRVLTMLASTLLDGSHV
jgi:hypothetical protein